MKYMPLVILMLVAALSGGNDSVPSAGPATSAPPPSSGAATPDGATHALILRYNQLLSESYKTTNMTRLQEVATPELAEKAYYHMAAIGEGKSRMVSELKKISFVETDCSRPLSCRVVTREWWDFGYADILTGKRFNEVKDYIYDVRYLAEYRQGRWLLTDISATGEERKEIPTWGKMFGKK